MKEEKKKGCVLNGHLAVAIVAAAVSVLCDYDDGDVRKASQSEEESSGLDCMTTSSSLSPETIMRFLNIVKVWRPIRG